VNPGRSKGTVHEKGWDGQYHPVEGLLGPKEGEIKHSLWTGERAPARDFLGDQKRAADGSPLYEAADGPAPEDALAGAMAGGVILAILAAIGVAAAGALAVARRFWANLRADIEARRLSLSTVGWGSALGYGVFFVLAFLSGPRTLGGTPLLLWTVSDTFVLVAFVIVMTVGPAEAAGRIRQSLADHQPADGLWRWLAGPAADGLSRFASYCNYDRLHGELDWHTPAERYDGTPFTARGFERVPALHHLNGWLTELMTASGRVSSSPGTTTRP
jgi:hypothetical protein